MTRPKTYLVDTDEKLRKLWSWLLAGSGDIGFDVETSGPNLKWRGNKTRPDPYRHLVTGFSLSMGTHASYIPVRHTGGPNVSVLVGKAVLSSLVDLAETGRVVWVHNLGYELNILINEGLYPEHVEIPSGFRCSQVAAWLAWTLRGKDVGLKHLAGSVLGLAGLPSFAQVSNGRQACDVPPGEMYEYGAMDAWLTAAVGAKAWDRLQDTDLVRHYSELDLPLVEITRGMARAGMARDRVRLEELRATWSGRRDAAKLAFQELTTTTVEIETKQDVPTGEFYKGGKREGEPKTRKAMVLTKLQLGADAGNDMQVSRWCYEYLKWWPIPEEWNRRKDEKILAYMP